MNKQKWLACVVVVAGSILTCGTAIAAETQTEIQAETQTGAQTDVQAKAQEYLAQMSNEEKAGQMLMVSPSQFYESGTLTDNMETVVTAMQQYAIGGIIYFAQDLENQDAVAVLNGELWNAGKTIPVLTAAAVNGSLTEGLEKPAAGAASILGTGKLVTGTDAVWAYSLTGAASDDLTTLGIQVDFAPGTDTHFALVTNEKVQNAMDDGRPASMSKSMITTTLKGEGAFDGVVATDSLSMAAATESYGGDMAVMYAFQAGADLIVAPANPSSAYYGILSAIDEQLVTEEQIDASVLKILEMKIDLGIIP